MACQSTRLFLLLPLFVLVACNHSAQSYISRGNTFFAAGKYADAQLSYGKAVQKDPRSGEGYYRLGLAYQKQNMAGESYQALRKAVELLPNSVEAKIALADVCFAVYFGNPRQPKEMYDQTAQLAAQILRLHPNSADGFRLQGALSLLDRKPSESAALYRKANELRPMDPDITLGYSQALFRDGQAAEGERIGLALLAKVPGYAPLYDSLYNEYVASNRLGEAERILKQWGEKNPRDSTAVLRLAAYYTRLNKPAEAAAAIAHMTERPADFPQAHMLAGDFYASAGNWAEAVGHYEKGAQGNSKDGVAYRKRTAGAMLAQDRRQEAASLLEAIVKDVPGDTEAHLMHARMQLDSGKAENVEAALRELESLLKADPRNAGLHYEIGRAHLLRADTEEARKSFGKAAQLRQDALPPRYALARLAASQQAPAEQLRYAEEILRISPADPAGRLFRSAGFIGAGRFSEARNELRSLLKEYPEFRDAQLQYGLLAIEEKRFSEADAIFRKLGEAGGDDVRPAVGLASMYASQKQNDRAIGILTEEKKKVPGSVIVQKLLARTALEAGRYPLAIENFQGILAANPHSIEAHVELAEAYRMSGDAGNATDWLQKARGLDSKDPAALGTLAAAFYNNGRLEESRELLRRISQLQSGNAEVLNSLAFLIAETGGDLNEAQRLVQQASQKKAGDAHIQDTMAWIYLKQNRTDDAHRILTSLVAKAPENPDYHYHLGATLLKQGDKKKARVELEAALTKKPLPAEAKNIRDLLAAIQ